MFTLHIEAVKEDAPHAVFPCENFDSSDPKFFTKELKGAWVRVIPKTAKDVLYLQMLEHHQDKFAPAEGNGVLVKADSLARRLVPFNQ